MKKNLFPFDMEKNNTQMKKLILNLSNLIFKLSNSNEYRLEDSSKLIRKLEYSTSILKNLYTIKEVIFLY
jgi:hypothetical protein